MDRVANRLRTTFVPCDDPDGSEQRIVAEQPIVIYRPKQRKVAGLTFVVTAANLPLSKYTSTINALTSVDHVVVGLFVNVLSPARGNHRAKAERIRQIFQKLRGEFRVKHYDIVGHSIGGKIALLAAALYDGENCIRSIVALDPVDQSPAEFTNRILSADGNFPPPNPFRGGEGDDDASAASTVSKRGRRTNLSLESSKADITLTFTDTGYWISKKHNAREIQKNNPSVKLVMHRNSFHMVYCDEEGILSWKALMGRGKSDDRNQIVREVTLTLIKERAMRSTITGHASGKMKSTVGKAKQAMTNGISDLVELGGDAQRKGSALAGAAALSKVMG
mmetsp:Transcript_14687/g.31911  ORF Transcript_14687/g.31911 Transcript_14687/m.31911 type:complete len:335 (-) Transcript_14687:104-1108(-)|eukprot:CAMPEP_0172313674 /NCGR_PEP_ID=MMETSP1058-20130122/20737_1 /TAXON_ID=83371 /ORGANISM="Detonula confervacea, Strain CCMP 353" /LENGTH=334 /DNA_ID=CAMNT_0013027371 /DNA_START=161 /DNA_END=1165 /DNA_ORIENTATION=+